MLLAELTGPSWNPVLDIQQLWSFPFMVNAYRAGTIVAVVAGLVGYFMVLRRQTFVGHALATVGVPGAAGAALLGLSTATGYFGFCVLAALVVALVSRRGAGGSGESAAESALTGVVQSMALGLGFLFIALYHGYATGTSALLFGSFLGITTDQVLVLLGMAVLVLGALAMLGRPLLFSSIDPAVAAARGVPVRALDVGYLLLLGVGAAEAAQITGALLVFALLVMPAATAQELTGRPGLGAALSVLIGLVVTWLGLGAAYFWDYPVGFFLTSFAFALYVLAKAGRWLADRRAVGSGGGAGEPAPVTAWEGAG